MSKLQRARGWLVLLGELAFVVMAGVLCSRLL
jgi:hypothetical protein